MFEELKQDIKNFWKENPLVATTMMHIPDNQRSRPEWTARDSA